MTMPATIDLCQPVTRTHSAYFSVHDYTQGPSLLHPGDANWESPFDQQDGGGAVVFELAKLPPSSAVRVVTYVSNRTRCSQFAPGDPSYNGDRLIADIWVAPTIAGARRAEKYLGYGLYQHLQFPISGEMRLVADASGSARALFGLVYGNAETPHVESCWYGPHIHQVASRDAQIEASDGTYTTGIEERFSSGDHGGLVAGSATFTFRVDWDL